MASKQTSPSAPKSGLRSALNTFHQVFFVANIFFMSVLDFQDLIPTGYKPEALGSVKEWYVRAKNDRFYIDPPVWHRVYLLIELYYTLPMMVWGVWAYGRDHRLAPLLTLVWAVLNITAGITCVAEISGWTAVTAEQKSELMWEYGGYLGPMAIILVDNFIRVLAKV